MKYHLTQVGQCVAATLSIALGTMIYGCADTASVNPVVELADLAVDPGTLQPSFSGETTQYNVDVSTNITSVTITAQPAVAGDTVTINGQTTTSSVITLGAPGTTTPVSIVVSESSTNSRTYTVLLVRADLTGNNSLQSLTVSPGTLSPPFDLNMQAYTTSVAGNVESITVTPTLSDPAATMTVNGQVALSGQGHTVPLNDGGQSTPITITVTAPNGASKSYLVSASRGVSNNNNLRSLTISPGTLNFRPTITSYTVNVASTATSVMVRSIPADAAASMIVNGQATDSGQARTIALNGTGSDTLINIIVIAQNGAPKTYTINITRAALAGNDNLSALTVSPGTLAPPFNPSTTRYTEDVESTVTSVTVTATLQDSNAGMEINGQETASGQARDIVLLEEGSSTTMTIRVTPPNGNAKTYTITVNRASSGDSGNEGGKGNKGGNGNNDGKGNKRNNENNGDNGDGGGKGLI